MTTCESQRDAGFSSIQQPVEKYNYPPYASAEATENLNNSYYKKYGPPAYGQPQAQEGAFQTSKAVGETAYKGGPSDLASYYETGPSTRWSLEKAITEASHGRRLHVGLKSARNLMHEDQPDYNRSWLFHLDPFQIQSWNLLQRVILNKENNAMQMYLYPPFKYRSTRLSDLGPVHALAGWEIPLEHTQATTLMKNAPLADIMQILMHDNLQDSEISSNPSIGDITRPEWLNSTQRASISASEFRQLQRDLRLMKFKNGIGNLPSTSPGGNDVVRKSELIKSLQTLVNAGNAVSAATQTTITNAYDAMGDDDPVDQRHRIVLNLRDMEAERVNAHQYARATITELQNEPGELVTSGIAAFLQMRDDGYESLIDQVGTLLTTNEIIHNRLASTTLNRLYRQLAAVFREGEDKVREQASAEMQVMGDALARMDAARQALEDKVTALEREHASKITRMQNEIELRARETQRITADRDNLIVQIDQKAIENAELGQTVVRANNDVRRLQGEVESLYATLKDAGNDAEQTGYLRAEIIKKENEIRAMETENIERRNENLKDFNRQLDQFKRRESDMNETLMAKEQQIAMNQGVMEKQAEQLRAYDLSLNDTAAKKSALEALVQQYASYQKRLEDQLQEEMNYREGSERTLRMTSEEVLELQQKIEELTRNHAQVVQDLERTAEEALQSRVIKKTAATQVRIGAKPRRKRTLSEGPAQKAPRVVASVGPMRRSTPGPDEPSTSNRGDGIPPYPTPKLIACNHGKGVSNNPVTTAIEKVPTSNKPKAIPLY